MPHLKTEFIIFSDVHAHEFKYGATKVEYPGGPGLYNSRLVDTLVALDEMKKYALENRVYTALFGGDLFHIRGDIATIASNQLHKFFSDAEGLNFTMIPGNHDYADRHGHHHSLLQFKEHENVNIMDTTRWANAGQFCVVSVPYVDNPVLARAELAKAAELARKSKEAMPESPVVLLGHLGFQGATVGSDYVLVSDGDVSTDDVSKGDFDACFFGHYHEHQKLFHNGWFVGALTQHNWGDVNGKRGFLHVRIFDDGNIDIKRVETTAPKFIVMDDSDEESLKQEVRLQDFVRYKTGAVDMATVEYQEHTVGAKVELIHVPLATQDIHLDMKGTFDPEQLLTQYCEQMESEGMLDTGLSLLRKAKECES